MLSLKSLINLTGQKLLLPFYHTVSDKDLPHIKHLYSIRSAEEFEKDIQFYLQYFNPITIPELIDIASKKLKLRKPSFLISFDDGLSEVFSVAYPILEKYGITAAVFLNSAFVDNKDIFYRYKASILIDCFSDKFQKVLNQYFKDELNIEKFKTIVLSIKYKDCFKLDEIAEIIQINFNDYLKTQKPYLTSQEITELKQRNFYVGAHSVNHPDFHEISFEEKLKQVINSIDFVQQTFNTDYRIFSFPFFDHRIEKGFYEKLQELNIDLSFGVSGFKKDSVANNLHRIPMEKKTTGAQRIIRERYFNYMLKSIAGKNVLKRN